MRRAPVALATAALVLGLAGCNSAGGISIPTIPSVTIPSITVPTVSIPTIPTITLPTRTETETVTQTSQPTTQTVTETSKPTPAPAPDPAATSGGLPAWLWFLIIVVVVAVIALIVWLVRRSQTVAAWDEKMHGARREAAWVEDSLIDQVNSRATTAEAAATWAAARPRLLTLDESIYALSTTAPDPERAAGATRLRGRLQALVDAVSADTATGDSATVDDLRVRRAAVAKARSDLRGLLQSTGPQKQGQRG